MSHGLYVHVPFCRQLCPYCDFNVVVRSAPPWPEFGRALLRELQVRRQLFTKGTRSVYFGGGTPSLAPPSLLAQVLNAAAPPSNAEVTLEVDPGTVDQRDLEALRTLGINRVSMGWQSTHDSILNVLGRGHGAQQALATYRDVRRAGFDNVSVDLMFAVPGQSVEHLAQDLQRLIDVEPEHVSLYGLTYHEGTSFWRRRARGQLQPVSEELEVAMMELIHDTLSAAGYTAYEVSNYARPGFEAVHNRSYWLGVPYLGIGPGAHSFRRVNWSEGWRWESRRSLNAYLKAEPMPGELSFDDPCIEMLEHLNAEQLWTERVLCGLRQAAGFAVSDLDVPPFRERLREGIGIARAQGWVVEEGGRVRPTRVGMRFADALAELFF